MASQECFADCYGPVKCQYYPSTAGKEGEVGVLSNGRGYLWSSYRRGFYPDELYNSNDYSPSITACAKQFPTQCAPDKCFVDSMSSCPGGPISLAPVETVPTDVCAVAQIDGNAQAQSICEQTCAQQQKNWTGAWTGRGKRECVHYNRDGTSPNEAGSICVCK